MAEPDQTVTEAKGRRRRHSDGNTSTSASSHGNSGSTSAMIEPSAHLRKSAATPPDRPSSPNSSGIIDNLRASANPASNRSASSNESHSQRSVHTSLKVADGGTHKRPKGRYVKEWPKVPWIRRPRGGDDVPWLTEDQQAGQWLNLFFDLAVAASLSSFGNNHDITQPSDIPNYLSYFLIIQWIWATQTYYDTRFQAEDVLHRIFKVIQIYLFVYIGAASGNWDLSKIRDPDSFSTVQNDTYELRVLANESYFTVLIAFLLSRLLLAIQYGIIAILGRKSGRHIGMQVSSSIVLLTSFALIVVSLAIPPNSQAAVVVKICLLYLTIALELGMLLLQLRKRLYNYIPVGEVAQRYGDFTLIILGESGFSNLTKAFNYAISGISENSAATYAQVFLAIGIMVFLYLFLFSWFKPQEEVTERRALIWQSIHIPLNLGIVLLLSAMVNTLVTISYAHGLDKVGTAYTNIIGNILNGTTVSDKEFSKIDKYLSRLPLNPDWETQSDYIASIANVTNPSVDVNVVIIQYFGQILESTTTSYNIELDRETQIAINGLEQLNATYSTDGALRAEIYQRGAEYLATILADPISDSLSGTLWLFPCAGFVLILAAVRSGLWYHLAGIDHYLIHGGMIIFGVLLGLLGLLDIGQTKVRIDVQSGDTLVGDVAPLYSMVVDSETPLVVVLLVYGLVYFVAVGAGAYFRRRKRKSTEVKEVHGLVDMGSA